MKVAISAAGRFHSIHLAKQLQRHGALKKLFSASYTSDDKKFIPSSLVANNSFINLLDNLYFRLRFSKFVNLSDFYVYKDNLFDQWSTYKIRELGELDLFIGWANYWLGSLDAIKSTGAKIILESGSRHIVDQNRLLDDEYRRLGVLYTPISDANRDKILQEYDAADYIMVPSKHVYESFIENGIDASKLLKVPYGVDLDRFYRPRVKPEKFRIIFVGAIGFQKGVHYLLDAWSNLKLKNAELLLVGYVEESFKSHLSKYDLTNVTLLGPMSQERLVDYYGKSSVFVLPSVQDGLAMVQAEAMASGLPIICSDKTGGEELVSDGCEGFIIPSCDQLALENKILFLHDNQDACYSMGLAAQTKVLNFSWDHYGVEVMKVYRSILNDDEVSLS